MMLQLWVKGCDYFFCPSGADVVECSVCKYRVGEGDVFIVQRLLAFKKVKDLVYCNRGECLKQIKGGDYCEVLTVWMVDVLPGCSRLVENGLPRLVVGRGDVFSQAWDVEGVVVHDRTVFAGRPLGCWDGLMVGGLDVKRLEELDRPLLDQSEAFALLDDLKDATPVLPESKKMLELEE